MSNAKINQILSTKICNETTKKNIQLTQILGQKFIKES